MAFVNIDLSLLWQVAEKVLLVAAGVLVNRVIERRARLVAYYGHVGRFQLTGDNQGQFIHTHSVVVRNTGRLGTKNVHVPHRGKLTAAGVHVSIEPPIDYKVVEQPNGTEEILFPILGPRQDVTLSYVYGPPITFGQINAPIYSDDGLAKVITVLPQPQWPRWVMVVLWGLVLIGAVSVIYGLIEVTIRFL